jgi:hypothetical protein
LQRISELFHRHEDAATPTAEKEAERVLRTIGHAVGHAPSPRGGGPRLYQYAQVKYWEDLIGPLYASSRGGLDLGSVDDRAKFTRSWLDQQQPEFVDALKSDFAADVQADNDASEEVTAFFNLKGAVPGDQLTPEARLTLVASAGFGSTSCLRTGRRLRGTAVVLRRILTGFSQYLGAAMALLMTADLPCTENGLQDNVWTCVATFLWRLFIVLISP